MLKLTLFKLTIRNLREKWIRFTLTMLSIVVGVMFMVGAFVLTDGLRLVFSDLADDIAGNADLKVRAIQATGENFERPSMPASVEEEIKQIDGVAETIPGIAALNVFISDNEGEPIIPNGPPAIGFNFIPSQFFVIEGKAPDAASEFAADATTVNQNGLQVGKRYNISGPLAKESFELVGVFNFGSRETNNSLGQTMAAFELSKAQEFLGYEGQYLEIDVVVTSGTDPSTVQTELEKMLEDTYGDKYEVLTQEAAAEEERKEFNQFITIFNTVLLVFAFISVFVSAFIINNTFQIILGQRVRELGLWRSIGATPRQVTISVLSESALLGLLSTVFGIGSGLLAARAMQYLLKQGGFALPDTPQVLQQRTIWLALSVGLGVTVGSSIIPALKAQRISPVSALNLDSSSNNEEKIIGRLLGGGTTAVLGVLGLATGLFSDISSTQTNLILIGVSTLLTFVGVNMLSPIFVRPIAGLLGKPLAVLKMPGRLARNNAVRNPRSTASTAGALMIGLALVGLATVVGESLRKTVVSTLDNAVKADYFVRPRTELDPSAGFPERIADDLARIDEIEDVVRYRFGLGAAKVKGLGDNPEDGASVDILAADLASVEKHIDGDIISGDIASADPLSSVALHSNYADELEVGVGGTVTMTFPDNQVEQLTIAAVYDDASVYGNWLISMELWEQHFTRREIAFLSISVEGLTDSLSSERQSELLQRLEENLADVLADYPVIAENRVEFRQNYEDQLNSFLIVITVLLGLSLLIALIGITNTLALSVFERTREIGLLRAVGMTRRQLRRAIRWEAAIISVFGALLGVGIGIVAGVAAVKAIPDDFVKDIAIPVNTLFTYVVIAAIAGLIAATGPAIRAGRMNVLEAVAQD